MTDELSSPVPPRFFGMAWTLGALRAQRWMWSESWCKWTRRSLPSVRYARQLGDGQRFELQRGAWMSVLVPMVVFSQFVDVLICQGAIHIIATGAQRWMLHGLLLFVSLWTVVWAVSLRSAMGHVAHLLSPYTLTLAIGFKQLCRIPLEAIAGVQAIDHKAARGSQDWFDVHKLKPRDVTMLTCLDKPTLLIELKPGSHGAWWTRNGVLKPLRRWVAVYADQPDALRAALLAALPASAAPLP
jgi:hypothetical protein